MFNKNHGLVLLTLLLLLLSVSSVCAAEPDNTTGDGGLNPVNPPIKNTTDIVKNTTNIVNVANMVDSELEKRDIIINNQDLRIKALENSSAEKDIKINELNNTVNGLKTDNVALKYNNTQLDKRVKDLEYSKLTQSNKIKSLEIDIQNLEESNKQLINSNKLLIDSNKQKDIDIKELKDSNNQLNNTVKQLVDSNKQKDVDIKELKLEIKELKENNKVINEKKDNLTNYILQMNANYAKLADDKELLKEEKDKLIAENKELKIKIETLNKEFNDYLSSEINLKQKLLS